MAATARGPRPARGRRVSRLGLIDSPISRAGYWWATLVGFTWGFLWSTGRVERRGGLIVFTGMPKWTFGRGGSCVGGCYLTDRNAGDVVLGHEAVHREQWRTYGMLFPLLYLIAGRNPLRNRFEIEAGLEAGGYLPRRRPARAPRAAASGPVDRNAPRGA
ncbi:Fe-S oxidoreductase [Agromyces sp. NPDC057865]|uniref:Fe-S oxidoreductase n=1 Tax=Agromyces sp. NPDC057865 TaxID=3346267 RepID=UPI00366DBB31